MRRRIAARRRWTEKVLRELWRLIFNELEGTARGVEFAFNLLDESRRDLKGAALGVFFELFVEASHPDRTDTARTAAQAVGGQGERPCVVLSDCLSHLSQPAR